MKTINLRWMYPHYRHDEFVDVTDEVWAAMYQAQREMENYLVYSFCCRTVVGIQVFVCHKVNVRTQQISQTLAEVEANRHTARKNGRQVYLATAVTHQRYSRWSRTQV